MGLEVDSLELRDTVVINHITIRTNTDGIYRIVVLVYFLVKFLRLCKLCVVEGALIKL